MPSSAKRMSRAQTAAMAQAQAESMANLIDQILYPVANGGANEPFQPNGFTIDTNGLWIECLNTNGVTSLGLRLHNTVSGDHYQLLSTRDLTYTNWDLGQILFNANDDYTDFDPVTTTNAKTFYRAHHANPVVEIYSGQYATEPDPTNSDPGQMGIFYVHNEGSATNAVTVYYRIGGTAQNDVDYSNLTGVVTIPINQNYAEIDIEPIAAGLKPDQTVILTLIQNTNYLVDPVYYFATNTLYANPQVYPVANGDDKAPCPNTPLTFNLASDAKDPLDPSGLSLTYSILTWPAHGTLTTNASPPAFYVTYTATNCYEGVDSFTFKVNNGRYDSAPATVTLTISDAVYANRVSAQTCRGTAVSFSLGWDNCGETLSYALLSNPAHGTLSGTAANLTYTPNDTDFTGTDSFDYIVYSGCGGDSATNTVTVTVGNENLNATAQTVMTGTNQPVAITLSAVSYDACKADTNYYTYTMVGGSGPSHGTLSGTLPHLTYKPNTNYEGIDSFQFTVSDGVWTAGTPATITIEVTAGPILYRDCNPFSTAVKLAWLLDPNGQVMFPEPAAQISDFIVYRSAVSGGNYTAIATNYNTDTGWMSYLDTNAVAGQTNYYVVTFRAADSPSGRIVQSPRSNEIKAAGQNFTPLIPADAIWRVVTNLNNPSSQANLQAPFSNYGTNQYPDLLPWPHTLWPVETTWSNRITMFIPSNSVPLGQVTYSIAIDNNYQLYLNNSNEPIESFNHEGQATWPPFKSFESVAPGRLHYGTNDLRVVIVDKGGINYFSMIVSTNACGW